mmetsp:Transcript_15102/g.26517  ORF Transcript_15102/g.26517 Transcript_15102/m.26517 type:complete len:808 (-) Transcript_15102:4272-6695(-)|eukprot:CAMPEP_0203764894 /NCGR_PEP_ID=MMETSP0098-20131031/18113_1 /ASSEMBLY_ACC=CAM_ASM_000208 /TAXON_ID=96639 /ORGANISM=" , Strain NY0313808BC1" /LENGTH=807 /DNA_ID=CAMNT_0050661095 /DNA_START=1694 /DNA_END=4117 /DNA_ORIENTATION=-
MKRALEEEGKDGVQPLERQASNVSVKKRKKKANPIKKKLPDTNSTKEQLVHKNRELAMAAKRLRNKLGIAQQKLSQCDRKEESLDASVSALHRCCNSFIKEAAQLVQNVNLDIDLEREGGSMDALDDSVEDLSEVKNTESFIRALFKNKAREYLLKKVSEVVPDTKNEEDEDKDEEEPLIASLSSLVEKETKRSLGVMLAILEQVTKRAVGTSEMFSPDLAQLRVQLKRSQAQCALYRDRTLALEKQVRKYRNELEDAENTADIAMRRLAAVCADAINVERLKSIVENLSEKGVEVKLETGQPVTAPAQAASVETDDKASKEAMAELDDARKLADTRLKEIETLVSEKKKVVEEMEKMRLDIISKSGETKQEHDHREGSLKNDDQEIERLKRDLNVTKADVTQAQHGERTALEQVQEAMNAMKEMEKRISESIKQREDEHVAALREKTKEIASLRQKIEEMRGDIKASGSLKTALAECESQLKFSEVTRERLEKELKHLKANPAEETYRKKLEDHLKAQSVPEETRTVALLEADLAASRKETEAEKGFVEELTNELESLAEAGTEMEKQNKRLLKKVKEKDHQANKWSSKILEMNERINKIKQQLKIAIKQKDVEQTLRLESDEQFSALKGQFQMTAASCTKAEQLARLTHEQFRSATCEKEELEAKYTALLTEKTELEGHVKRLEENSIEARKEKEDAMYKMKRTEEEKSKIQKRFERTKSNIPSLGGGAGGDLRAEAMENALRCPLRSEYWKDAIITRCCHMFSRRALEDNLAKRNRKCPTCKLLYSKDDISNIYLYEKNEYDFE